jgi:DNA gyrase/topoisomerase IV subunit B
MHAPKLVEIGRVYVAQPPLLQGRSAVAGQGKTGARMYCLDDDELEERSAS